VIGTDLAWRHIKGVIDLVHMSASVDLPTTAIVYSHSITMLWQLLSSILIFHFGILLISFTRFVVHAIFERVILRNIPGPAPSSFLWGEEWDLYYGAPGLPYAIWHKKFGKVVRFSGAFGVSRLSFAIWVNFIKVWVNSIRFCP
jgi:hypothetical protein